MTLLRRLTTLAVIAAGSAVLACPSARAEPAAPATTVANALASDPVDLGTTDTADPADSTNPDDVFEPYIVGMAALRALGIDPFLYPTAAAFCSGTSTLGVVPALAGAIPGPWPKTGITIPGLDLASVKSGQTLFTFVPFGVKNPDNLGGMRVAWFNAANFKSGIVGMGPFADLIPSMIPASVPPNLRLLAEQTLTTMFDRSLPLGGVRAVPVDTGRGLVLAAMFGTVENGGRSCFFLPTVGISLVS